MNTFSKPDGELTSAGLINAKSIATQHSETAELSSKLQREVRSVNPEWYTNTEAINISSNLKLSYVLHEDRTVP